MSQPLTPELLGLVKEHAKRQARKNFKNFIGYTKPDFDFGWYNFLLAKVLQKFYQDYQAGKNPRLMIFAPPRIGKTEEASRRFPAWCLGQDPTFEFMATSYAADLANKNSRDVQRIIDDRKYRELFPETRISSKGFKTVEDAKKTDDYWELLNDRGQLTDGSYRAAGVGKGISGMGFGIGMIDDPVKDYKEASSATTQERNIEWYNTTFYTRRNPKKNGIILIMTRWHIMDLAGKLLEKMKDGGDQWEIFSFPMEAEQDEYFTFDGVTYKTREAGEILFPARMDQKFVEDCKQDEMTWTSLYQQQPNIRGGNFFKTDWFGEYHLMPKFKRKIITVDTAQKKGQHNDFSVFQLWGLGVDGYIYLLDQVRGKFASHELRDRAVKFWKRYGGGIKGPVVNASAMYIEDKVSGTGLIQELRVGAFHSNGEKAPPIPCIPIERTIDKVTRAVDKQAIFQSGFIHIPQNALWKTEYLMEFENFSLDMKHPHDDQVDCTLDAIDVLLKGKGGMNFGAMA